MERQSTFEDIARVQVVTSLTEKQKRIIALLGEDCTQGIIAGRLGVSRSFVSQTIRYLETHSLVKKKFPSKYNTIYELSPQLRQQVRDPAAPQLTTCRVHNIRRKYRIISQSHTVSLDKRAGFMKKWEMRGGTRYKFWYSGKAGEPSVTLDIHPKTIVAYPDKGQGILAATITEAEDRMNMAVHNAVRKFIAAQEKFHVHIQYDELGKTISETHYGFVVQKGGSAQAELGTTIPGFWVDGSPADLGNPEQLEFETKDKSKATPLDKAIQRVVGMPEGIRDFEKSFGPLTEEIHSVLAHIQSGQSVQNQINQLVVMFGTLLKQQHELIDMMVKKNVE